jgi:hypothetical protein
MSWRIVGVACATVGLYLVWIALGYGELTNGISSFCERVGGGVMSLPVSWDVQDRGKVERENDITAYAEAAGTICLGVCIALWAFRTLPSAARGRGRNGCLFVLIVAFVLCAYGFGLLLELAAEGG